MITITIGATGTDPSGHDGQMARSRTLRKYGPLGAALTLYDIWRRLPPRQRRWALAQARKHGPRIAKQALKAQQDRRRR